MQSLASWNNVDANTEKELEKLLKNEGTFL